jgi:signal transduction histidine kinase
MHNEAPAASASRSHAGAAVADSDLVDRVAELDALVTFLQADFEQRSGSVARKLHDEIGGAVIGAMMDVAWIEQHDAELTADTSMRLGRVKDGLRGAIDLARTMVEELRPTLLDSVGLFAALSWQFRRGCATAGIGYQETYPESAPEMEANKLVALFRIAQEAFNIAIQQKSVSAVRLSVDSTDEKLILQLADDRGTPAGATRDGLSTPMSSIFHRVKQLNGEAAITSPSEGGSVFRVTIPLD